MIGLTAELPNGGEDSRRAPRRARIAHFFPIALLIVCQGWATISVSFIPAWVATHPVALEVVNGSILSVAAAGAFVRTGGASLLAAWVAPLPLWLAIDSVSWWAGRRFGAQAARWLARRGPRAETAIRRSERFFSRHRLGSVVLAPWLPVPGALLYAISGWRGLSLLMFLTADAVGTATRDGVVLWIGYATGTTSVRLIQQEARFAAVATGAVIVLLLVLAAQRTWSLRRAAAHESGTGTAETVAATRAHYEAFPFVAGGTRRVRHWIQRLRPMLPDEILRPGPVLDVGCGSGEITRGLAQRGARMVSVDLTWAAAVSTANLNPGQPVCQASALGLPFADAAFGHSVSIGVLHHTPDAASGLREIVRVTRPGGRIVVLLYARWTPYHAIYLLTAPLRARIPVQTLDRTPRIALSVMRSVVALQVGQRLTDEQLRRLLADQVWTPQASFHSWRQLKRWADEMNLAVVERTRLFCHANLVAFERKLTDDVIATPGGTCQTAQGNAISVAWR